MSLLKGLLTRDASFRLGTAGRRHQRTAEAGVDTASFVRPDLLAGSQSVSNHAFFQEVDWRSLRAATLKAPWVPVLSGPGDVSMCDVDDTVTVTASQPVLHNTWRPGRSSVVVGSGDDHAWFQDF